MILLAACASLLSLHAQGRHLPPELETEGDRPAAFLPQGKSPRLIVPFGPYVSYQVNVDSQGRNILGDAANEPSLCIDPSDSNRIAIGWRQFDSVTSNFRQAGFAYSGDRGVTWTFPGRINRGVFRSDPVLAARYDGKFF